MQSIRQRLKAWKSRWISIGNPALLLQKRFTSLHTFPKQCMVMTVKKKAEVVQRAMFGSICPNENNQFDLLKKGAKLCHHDFCLSLNKFIVILQDFVAIYNIFIPTMKHSPSSRVKWWWNKGDLHVFCTNSTEERQFLLQIFTIVRTSTDYISRNGIVVRVLFQSWCYSVMHKDWWLKDRFG